MEDDEHRAMANALLPVIVRAGAIELDYFRRGVVAESKDDDSPVTAADREAEDLIAAELATLYPDIPLIGEEAASLGRIPAIAHRFFLVDPLDGTREFVAGRPEFTVNVALVVDGQPRFGAVYHPPTGRLYVSVGAGAAIELDVPACARPRSLDELPVARIRTRAPATGDLTVAVSRSHASTQLGTKLRKLGIENHIATGSSLKFCLVARGDADVYPRLSSISEWDTAAGHAVLQAAGGCVLGLDNRPLAYGNADLGFRVAPFVAWGDRRLSDRLSFA